MFRRRNMGYAKRLKEKIWAHEGPSIKKRWAHEGSCIEKREEEEKEKEK